MSKTNYRIALVGFGYWGPNLARASQSLPNITLVAIVEKDTTRHLDISKAYPSILVFSSVEELISVENLFGVMIATPPATHFLISLYCLNLGWHVLVEKPIAMSATECIEIAKLSKSRNLVAMPGHTFLFNGALNWVKDYILDGNLGDILYIYSQRLNLGQIRQDIDVVWNLAPHDVSIFDYIIGNRAISVSATATSCLGTSFNDVAFLTLNYPGGIMAHAHVSWLDPSKTRKLTIVGSKKMAVLDDTLLDTPVKIYEKSATRVENAGTSFAAFKFQINSGDIYTPMIEAVEPLVKEIEEFIDSAVNLRPPRASIEDGLSVARTLTSAMESIKDFGETKSIGLKI